jgi:hypothetical protein
MSPASSSRIGSRWCARQTRSLSWLRGGSCRAERSRSLARPRPVRRVRAKAAFVRGPRRLAIILIKLSGIFLATPRKRAQPVVGHHCEVRRGAEKTEQTEQNQGGRR